MTLMSKEDTGWIGRASLASKKFDFVVKFVSVVFQWFK